MRDLPAGWPDPSEKVQTTPTVYLHVLDSVWPPASVTASGESLPAGWAVTGSGSIDSDLVAPLLPGQVSNDQTGFTSATAKCTIPQPKSGISAPWRFGAERTPTSGRAELWASHDGYDGDTAFLLGRFLLDPISGKVSEPFLSLNLVQDVVRLRKDHDLPLAAYANVFDDSFSPTRLLEAGAEANGYTLDSTADFEAELTSSYFPAKTDELTAMQQIVAANLGSMFPSMDGTTLQVLDPDYLLGAGEVLQTIQVLDTFADLSWSQDPNAAVDRIEVTFLPPAFDDTPLGPFPYDGAVVWSAPKGAKIAAGHSATYAFDPGSAASMARPFGMTVYGNTAKDGTDAPVDLQADVTVLSSGSWTVEILNDTADPQYLMAPYIPPGVGVGTTDYVKGTRSFLAGSIDGATESDSTKTLSWGMAAADATNTLTFALGRNIQTQEDAQRILDRIITRVTTPSYVIDDVQVVPDVGRELADLYRLEYLDAGFNTRAMVTGVHISWSSDPSSLTQSLTIAAMPLVIRDFNEAWDAAFPGGATIADFDSDPLET